MKKYIRNNDTISGRLHDEIVMMDIEKGKYFSMNPIATHIWDLLEKPMNADDICNQLMEEYEVDISTCQKEVNQFIDEMMQLNLIQAIIQ